MRVYGDSEGFLRALWLPFANQIPPITDLLSFHGRTPEEQEALTEETHRVLVLEVVLAADESVCPLALGAAAHQNLEEDPDEWAEGRQLRPVLFFACPVDMSVKGWLNRIQIQDQTNYQTVRLPAFLIFYWLVNVFAFAISQKELEN